MTTPEPVPTPVTTTTTTTRVRVERTHWVKRGGMWLLAPFVDGWTGLSLNRFLSVLFAIAATHRLFVHDVPLTVWDCTMATLSGALAFGKDVVIAFFERKQKEGVG